MDYIAAAVEMADTIYNILHTTIKTVYPQYYPQEVVDFFCNHHSKEHILDGIASGNMGVFMKITLQGCMYCRPAKIGDMAHTLWIV